MKERIVLIGGGGHCKVIIDVLRLRNRFRIEGIVDPNLEPGKSVESVPVLGGDEILPTLRRQGVEHAFIALAPLDYRVRVTLYKKLKEMNFIIPNILHPLASVSTGIIPSNSGIFAAVYAVVNPAAVIDRGAVINTSASVDHDCRIGEWVQLSPGVRLGGNVTIGDNSYIGMGAVVLQGVTIGKNSIIGAGSVVVKDIEDNVKAFGNPCRVRNRLNHET